MKLLSGIILVLIHIKISIEDTGADLIERLLTFFKDRYFFILLVRWR
jgi:hypothetical protein